MGRLFIILLFYVNPLQAMEWWTDFPACDTLALGKPFVVEYGYSGSSIQMDPELPEMPAGWQLIEADSLDRRLEEGDSLVFRRLELAVFSLDADTLLLPGNHLLPDLAWPFQLPSRLAAEAEPAELIGPVSIPGSYWKHLIWLLLLLPVALVYWLLHGRRKSQEQQQATVYKLDPWEHFQKAMRQIDEEALFAKGRVEEHFAALSLALRGLLEDCLELPCRERSTLELHDELHHKLLDTQDLQSLFHLLEENDRVKYAREWPDAETCARQSEAYAAWARERRGKLMQFWQKSRLSNAEDAA